MSRSPTPSSPARNRGWRTGFSTTSPAPCAALIFSGDEPWTTTTADLDQVDALVPAPHPSPLPVSTGRGRDPRAAWEGEGPARHPGIRLELMLPTCRLWSRARAG